MRSSRELLGELLSKGVSASEFGAHVFVHYSGHVDKLEVQVYRSEWKEEVEPDYADSFYVHELEMPELEYRLKKAILEVEAATDIDQWSKPVEQTDVF